MRNSASEIKLAATAARKTGLRPIASASPPKGSSIVMVVSEYTPNSSENLKQVHTPVGQRKGDHGNRQTHRKAVQKLMRLKHPDVPPGRPGEGCEGKLCL